MVSRGRVRARSSAGKKGSDTRHGETRGEAVGRVGVEVGERTVAVGLLVVLLCVTAGRGTHSNVQRSTTCPAVFFFRRRVEQQP